MIRRFFTYNPFAKNTFAPAEAVYQQRQKDMKLQNEKKLETYSEEKVLDVAYKSVESDPKAEVEARDWVRQRHTYSKDMFD